MKRVCGVVMGLLIAGMVFGTDFDTMTNDLSKVLRDGSTAIAQSLAKNVGYYTGSGNVTAANASGLPGVKMGVGLGTVMPGYVWAALFSRDLSAFVGGLDASKNAEGVKQVAQVVGAFPLSYDEIYGKIGVPLVPMDIGLRLGYFPTITFGTADANVAIGFFHFGAEARYKLAGINLVFAKSQIEARLSYDYDTGVIGAAQKVSSLAYEPVNNTVIGTNEMTMTMDNKWSGSSLGLKVVGGLSVLMFDVYGGIGGNFNFGEVNTTLTAQVAFKDTTGSLGNQEVTLTGSGKSNYDLFDLRLLVGAHFFVSDIAVEWNPLNNALAITVVPVSIAF
ncbi:hypothetical protein [Thermospira aquatica]|uniref:Uncharacterized protein n=1 Tax=Thermospira aquatica TaxID=2828656 RepID=A0AAX3BDG9_9SPIR|nr:hypothetical protein [Thermospira aquatica]URA10165.1 hypothetical protein KDW03_11905 [Thermospira aquatica]